MSTTPTTPATYRKADGPCRCGAVPKHGDRVAIAGRKVVACTACNIDCLARTLASCTSLADLLGPVDPRGYFPTIYPDSADHVRLADAYDAAQAARGDSRRAYRGRKAA